MTDFINDAVSILKFSFSWLKRPNLWLCFLGGVIGYALLNSFQSTAGMRLLYKGLSLLVAIILFVVVDYLVTRASMQLKGYKLIENSPMNFIRFLILGIYILIVAVFSLFELKFLAVAIASVVFLAIGFAMAATLGSGEIAFIAVVPLGLGALLALAYFVITIRNVMRLIQAQGNFLTGKGIRESTKLSWNTTPKMAGKIFIINLLVSLPLALISYAGGIIEFLLNLPGNSELAAAGAIIAAIFSGVMLISTTTAYAGFYEWVNKARPLRAGAKQAKIKEGKKARAKK